MAIAQKIVVEAGEGASVWLGGVGVDFKIPAEMTGGAFSIVEHPLDPGRLIPPHIHYKEDELSYVLRGEIGVRIGDQDYVAGPGSYVFKPRGVPHTFWPAGFESFFAALGELAASCPPEEFPERRAALARDYDHYFVHPEWVPELESRYGLKVLGED
jgi:quercetin dioxygenase-like cupin family protein